MRIFTYKRSEKGIALVEVMVSIFVFVLMVTSTMGVLSALLQKRSSVKKMQQQTEEFSLATGYMAKKIRMSDAGSLSCSGLTCTIHDNTAAAGTNTTFFFDAATATLKEGTNVIATNVVGGFSTAGPLAMPIVTVHMMYKDPATGASKPETSVQTSVSLRSY